MLRTEVPGTGKFTQVTDSEHYLNTPYHRCSYTIIGRRLVQRTRLFFAACLSVTHQYWKSMR